MGFLKNFLSGEKTAEEKNLVAAQHKHDVLVLDAGDDATAAADAACHDDDASASYGGCCGGGCRS